MTLARAHNRETVPLNIWTKPCKNYGISDLYQPLFGKMSPHSSIKDRTRETAEIELNYNSVRYFNTRQWTPANSPGRLCGSVRTVSLEKELLGTSALA